MRCARHDVAGCTRLLCRLLPRRKARSVSGSAASDIRYAPGRSAGRPINSRRADDAAGRQPDPFHQGGLVWGATYADPGPTPSVDCADRAPSGPSWSGGSAGHDGSTGYDGGSSSTSCDSGGW